MRGIKHSVRALLFTVILLVSFVVPTSTANAASDYDDLLQVSPTLYVYTDGSAKTQKMDISATWWAEFKQTYAKRIAQNIGWPADFVAKFENIVESGGSWGVYTQETSDGKLVSIVGTHDPTAYCGFVGSISSGSYQCTSNSGYGFIRADYFTHNSYGGNGCIGSYDNRCSDTGMNVYDSPTVVSGTAGYTFVFIPTITLSSYQFFFMNFNLQYPQGYEGELIPTEPPTPKYVAIGESFSSGKGNSPFEAGTAEANENECHRSPRAYPRLLQADLNLGSTAFVACSGATTTNVLGGQWNEPSQVSALSSATEVVTGTMGGNDAGFGNYVISCLSLCGPGTPAYMVMMGGINDEFKEKLKNTYRVILSMAPNAHVYIADYPYMSAELALSCGPYDLSGARSVQVAMNAKIIDAINEVNNPRLHYVPTNYTGSPFNGKHLCTSDPAGSFFSILTMHPDANGHQAYKEVFELAIA